MKHGPSLHYTAAVSKRKSVWCSPGYIVWHPTVYDLVSSRPRMRDSNWTRLPDKDAVLRQARRKSNASKLLIFVLPREQRSEEKLRVRACCVHFVMFCHLNVIWKHM